MNRKRLLTFPPCQVPENYEEEYDPEDVVAASQVLQREDGEPVLEIDLFYAGELRARYFADDEELHYAVWLDGKWVQNTLNNAVRQIKAMEKNNQAYYYYNDDYVWATDKDKGRVNKLLTYSIGSWEGSVNANKRYRADRRRQQKIQKLVESIPFVPKEAEEWAEEKFFPGHFLFVDLKEKQYQYTCTACGSTGERKRAWKHCEQTTCPACGQPVKVNRKKQEVVSKTVKITLLQKINEDQWAERLFKVFCTWDKDGKQQRWNTNICAIIDAGKTWGKVYYGQEYGADELAQDWHEKNTRYAAWSRSYLWPGNLDKILPMGGIERRGIDILAEKGYEIQMNYCITTAAERPYLEYLTKSGLCQLAADIINKCGYWSSGDINGHAKTLKELLLLDGNRINRLKVMNGGLYALRWLQYEQRTGRRISDESIKWLSTKQVSPSNIEELIPMLGSVNRLVNYAKKQRVKASELVITWRDYLRMAEAEGMDIHDDIVRFPRDLKARHDELVEIGNARRDAEKLKKEKEKYARLNRKIKKNLPKAEKYSWKDKNYTIIPAQKCEELIAEGRTLHHCVGRSNVYMNKMADGRTWICFLRKNSALKTPYYTLEIDMKDDRIIQWYSEFDRKPDQEVIQKVLDKFKNSVKRKADKPAAATA